MKTFNVNDLVTWATVATDDHIFKVIKCYDKICIIDYLGRLDELPFPQHRATIQYETLHSSIKDITLEQYLYLLKHGMIHGIDNENI